MKAKPKRKLAELCSVDEHGNVSDTVIHNALEALAHPVAGEHAMADTRERARRRGLSEELIERMYGKPRSAEELERALEEVREQARRFGWAEDDIERHCGKPGTSDAE